ncbi:hypothetical protein OpiT1DRAFT_00764 [Opitutaceae bacterium TAV1]|nr:hypothetical protein OpiT1DRAFT_00764 [Opitutaceae bacterium TAV1]
MEPFMALVSATQHFMRVRIFALFRGHSSDRRSHFYISLGKITRRSKR